MSGKVEAYQLPAVEQLASKNDEINLEMKVKKQNDISEINNISEAKTVLFPTELL